MLCIIIWCEYIVNQSAFIAITKRKNQLLLQKDKKKKKERRRANEPHNDSQDGMMELGEIAR